MDEDKSACYGEKYFEITATTSTIEHVRAAMRGPLPGFEAQITMAPQPRPFSPPPGVEPRQAGVLLLLYPIHGVLHLALSNVNAMHEGLKGLPGEFIKRCGGPY